MQCQCDNCGQLLDTAAMSQQREGVWLCEGCEEDQINDRTVLLDRAQALAFKLRQPAVRWRHGEAFSYCRMVAQSMVFCIECREAISMNERAVCLMRNNEIIFWLHSGCAETVGHCLSLIAQPDSDQIYDECKKFVGVS